VENKPKKNLLQLLFDFFKGIRKQDTKESPTETAAKGEPVKKEPAQTQPRQPPATQAPDPARPETAGKGGKFPLWILLPVILALPVIAGIVVLFIVIRRKLEAIPVRSISYVAGRTVASPPRRDVTAKLDTNPMVYLEVDDQNRNIGRRNTHSLKAGSTYTVGGGKSDFLIFLVPLPPPSGYSSLMKRNVPLFPKSPATFPKYPVNRYRIVSKKP
jgi:hypothetical protein